jgi:hypothetical protein
VVVATHLHVSHHSDKELAHPQTRQKTKQNKKSETVDKQNTNNTDTRT